MKTMLVTKCHTSDLDTIHHITTQQFVQKQNAQKKKEATMRVSLLELQKYQTSQRTVYFISIRSTTQAERFGRNRIPMKNPVKFSLPL